MSFLGFWSRFEARTWQAWRIDFTTVRAGEKEQAQLSYEVELELNSKLLQRNLEAKMNQKPHQMRLPT